MNTKCLVNEKGFITTNEPLFLCKWNGGDIVEIHTRLTLYATYKNTGLYDNPSTGDGWSNFESINDLLDHLSFTDKDNYNYFDNEKYTNDNMSIQRIY